MVTVAYHQLLYSHCSKRYILNMSKLIVYFLGHHVYNMYVSVLSMGWFCMQHVALIEDSFVHVDWTFNGEGNGAIQLLT